MDALWASLAALGRPSDVETSALAVERLHLADGTRLDVYKAETAPGPVTLWRVRGFLERDGEPPTEQQAAVLGTKDGRAVVRFSDPGLGMAPITEHAAATRALSDLSEVVAAAVRRLMGPAEK